MAEISSSSSAGNRSGKRIPSRGHAPRVDMTAMVDVAFLLLTFFVLSAHLLDSRLMELAVPPSDPHNTLPVDESKVLTILLLPGDSLAAVTYVGGPVYHALNQGPESLRTALQRHQNLHHPKCSGKVNSDCWDPIVVVKVAPGARYGALVDVLDELAITETSKYALAPFTAVDSLLISQN